MEAEWYTIPPATREAMAHARRIGGRIIAVGTSSVRALESYAITGDAEGLTGPLHLSRLSLQAGRRDDHQLPYAAHHRARAGDGAGRPRADSCRLPRRDPPSLSVSQLRRRDADPLMDGPDHSSEIAGVRRRGAHRAALSPRTARSTTPAFMPVGTRAAVKAMAPDELWEMGYRLVLANAYHLAVRPGPELVHEMGGIARFMGFPGAMLTDSGGFQAMSLAKINSINEGGIRFRSHLDGARVDAHARKRGRVQQTLGSDIMMALDECTPFPADDARARKSLELDRAMGRALSARAPRARPRRCSESCRAAVYADLRRTSAAQITALRFDGFATGGLSVGEPKAAMLRDGGAAAPRCCPPTAALPDGRRHAGRSARRDRDGLRYVRLRAAHAQRAQRLRLHQRRAALDQTCGLSRATTARSTAVRLPPVPDLSPGLLAPSIICPARYSRRGR